MAGTGQFARLTAIALATGTLVAAGAAPAGAAAAPTSVMEASGKGSALTITINLPSALSGTPLGTKIVQQISLTDGSVSTLTQPLADTTAILGKGSTPVLSDLLNQSTRALLSGEREQSTSARTIDQDGLKLALLPLTSKVAEPTLDGVIAHSSSGVARASVAGLALPQLDLVTAPVAETLETALGTVSAEAPAAVGTVTDTVSSAIDQLNAATDNSATPVTAPVQQAIDTTVAELTATLTDLTGTLDLLTSATDLVTLESIVSDQVISRKGSEVTSTVTNGIKEINVLNGLVKITGIESAATAIAGGKPGTGAATTKAPVLDISLADGALTAILDEKGINVGGTVGEALPADLQGAVNDALATVNQTLADTIGLDVQIGKGATSIAPDGTSALAAVSATAVTINPLGIAELLDAGTEFMKLELVTANAAVNSQLVPPPSEVPTTATPVSLPRTGGELPLTGAVAALLVGTALVARRRRATV